MSWREFVVATMGADQQQEAAAKASLNASTISRWLNTGKPGEATNVAAFARAYGTSVLEAFVAAGFLSADEAKARPQRAPDFTQLTNDELLELVRARMREEGEGHGNRPAANKPPEAGPGNQPVLVDVSDLHADEAARNDPKHKRSRPRTRE